MDKLDRTQVVNLTRATEHFTVSLLESLSGGIVRIGDDGGAPTASASPAKTVAVTGSGASA
jgi:hypothetical protein